MEDTDLAYIAGLLDGEGTIGINKNVDKRNRKTPTIHYRLHIAIVNSDAGIIRWLNEIFPASHWFCSDRRGQKPIYRWYVYSRKAYEFLQMVSPYLKIKKAQADLAIGFCEAKTSYARKKGQKGNRTWLPESESSKRLDFYSRMRGLNNSHSGRPILN